MSTASRPYDTAVNCVCVVGGTDLWVGGASGDLSVFVVATGEKKVKAFLAHDKGAGGLTSINP